MRHHWWIFFNRSKKITMQLKKLLTIERTMRRVLRSQTLNRLLNPTWFHSVSARERERNRVDFSKDRWMDG